MCTIYFLYGCILNVPDLVMIGATRFKLDGSKTDLFWVMHFVLRRKAARGTVTYIAAD